jgi:glycosyltransferase involved in cell wall biosynthesis
MRAVLISPNPSSTAGGVERFCTLLSAILESAGWTTSVIGPDIEVPVPLGRIGLAPSLQAVAATRRARAEHADLVISNGFLGGPAGRQRIHVFHGTMVRHVIAGGTGSRRYRFREAVGGAIAEALCGRGATVVAVSSSTARELGHLYRQPVDAVIPNGVDTDLFSPGDRDEARSRLQLTPGARYALFVGRFERRKGADLVSAACQRAGFQLLVAGPQAPATAVALGTLRPSELVWAYRAADCVLFPTRYEACSFVVLEALACGVPLITTAVGWTPELLAHCPGYRRFIVLPNLDSVTNGLRHLESGTGEDSVGEAMEFVREHNSLAGFGRRWLELIDRTVAR